MRQDVRSVGKFPRFIAVGVLLVTAAVLGAVVSELDAPASSSASPVQELPSSGPGDAPLEAAPVPGSDGELPGGVTAFDDRYPGVTNLNADLLRALRAATNDAAAAGIEVHVNSGWRSPAYQDRIRRQAVAEYGSEQEAARGRALGQALHLLPGKAGTGSLVRGRRPARPAA